MDKNEFKQKQNKLRSFRIRTLLVFLSSVVLILFIAFFADSNDQTGDISSASGSIAMVGTILAALITLVIFGRKLRAFGLKCPYCSKPLVGTMGKVAIATDKCGHCGRLLFEESIQPASFTPDAVSPIPTAQPLHQKELAYLSQKLQLNTRHKAGAGWFLWIGGMTLINTIMLVTESKFRFVTGLGLTRLIDAITISMVHHRFVLSNAMKVFSLVFDAVAIGTFIFIWIKARDRQQWAFIAGFILYAVDAPVLILFKDWFGIGFHVFALIFIYRGWKALQELNQVESSFNARNVSFPS
jgi:hypothetical protein